MKDKEKQQSKLEKAEQRRKAKEERQRIFAEVNAKKQTMKAERERLLKLYTQKEVELRSKFESDITAAGTDEQRIKLLKAQYKQDLWDLHNQRDYALAKYYVSDKTQRRQKMKVDKRIAYHEYDKQKKVLAKNLKTELEILKKDHKANVAKLKSQYTIKAEYRLMKQFRNDIAPFKRQLRDAKASLKQDYNTNVKALKANYKDGGERVRQLDKARDSYETKLAQAKATYTSQCDEARSKLNIQFNLQTYNDKLIDESNDYESKYIQARVNYKNKLVQLKQKRDLSYEYELDTGFTIRRWWFGVGKEFQRMSWPAPKKTVRDLMIVLAITIFLAVIFLIIDVIFSKTGIMK